MPFPTHFPLPISTWPLLSSTSTYYIFPSLLTSAPHAISSLPRAPTLQRCQRISHQTSPTISHFPSSLEPPWSKGSITSCSRMLASVVLLMALGTKLEAADPFTSMPPNLSGAEKPQRVQRPSSPKAERCTQKCVATCIRGGAGSPGEGPLNIRRPLVVFKEGFRTRQYCLVECSDICNLIGDGDDGP